MLLKGAMRQREGTHQFTTPQTTGEIRSASRTSAGIRATAAGGWMDWDFSYVEAREVGHWKNPLCLAYPVKCSGARMLCDLA